MKEIERKSYYLDMEKEYKKLQDFCKEMNEKLCGEWKIKELSCYVYDEQHEVQVNGYITDGDQILSTRITTYKLPEYIYKEIRKWEVLNTDIYRYVITVFI